MVPAFCSKAPNLRAEHRGSGSKHKVFKQHGPHFDLLCFFRLRDEAKPLKHHPCQNEAAWCLIPALL